MSAEPFGQRVGETCDVVVVSYGSGGLLDNCLRTARHLAPEAQVFVVNNDGTDLQATSAAQAVGVHLIVNATNRGFAAAVNQAILAGSGEYVILLNPDVDLVLGDIRELMHVFEGDPSIAAVAVRLLNHDGTVQHSCRNEPSVFDFVAETLGLASRFPSWRRVQRFRMLDWDHDCERIVDAASGALLVLRRNALGDVGLLDEAFFVYSEELDWLIRAKRKGWRTRFSPSVVAIHRGGGSTSESGRALSLLLVASWHTYARKHLGPIRAFELRLLLAVLDVMRLAYRLLKGRDDYREVLERLRVHLGPTAGPAAARLVGTGPQPAR